MSVLLKEKGLATALNEAANIGERSDNKQIKCFKRF